MDAHRTVQGTAVISTTTRRQCGAAVATPVRSCSPTKLPPQDKKQSPQEFKRLSYSSVSREHSRWPACTASNDKVIPGGVKLVNKGSLAKRETGAFENSVRAGSAGATGLVTNGMSLSTIRAQAIDWTGQC
jgi:hypothetical protein